MPPERTHSPAAPHATRWHGQAAALLCDRGCASQNTATQMFVKYNGVLRGLRSKVPFLRTMMILLCCAKEVAAKFKAGSISFEEASILLNR